MAKAKVKATVARERAESKQAAGRTPAPGAENLRTQLHAEIDRLSPPCVEEWRWVFTSQRELRKARYRVAEESAETATAAGRLDLHKRADLMLDSSVEHALKQARRDEQRRQAESVKALEAVPDLDPEFDWRDGLKGPSDRSLMLGIPGHKKIIRDVRRTLRSGLGLLAAVIDAQKEVAGVFDTNDLSDFPEALGFTEAKRRAKELRKKLHEVDDELDELDRAFQHGQIQELDGVTWQRVVKLTDHVPPLDGHLPKTVLTAAVGLLAREPDPDAVIAEFERERHNLIDGRFGTFAPGVSARLYWPWITKAEQDRFHAKPAAATSEAWVESLRKTIKAGVKRVSAKTLGALAGGPAGDFPCGAIPGGDKQPAS